MWAAPAAVAAASASRVRCDTEWSSRSSVPSRSVATSRYGKGDAAVLTWRPAPAVHGRPGRGGRELLEPDLQAPGLELRAVRGGGQLAVLALDLQAPGLELRAVRGGGQLAVLALGRDPRLAVVLACRGGAQVGRGDV